MNYYVPTFSTLKKSSDRDYVRPGMDTIRWKIREKLSWNQRRGILVYSTKIGLLSVDIFKISHCAKHPELVDSASVCPHYAAPMRLASISASSLCQCKPQILFILLHCGRKPDSTYYRYRLNIVSKGSCKGTQCGFLKTSSLSTDTMTACSCKCKTHGILPGQSRKKKLF